MQSIDGLSGGSDDGRRSDWFFYVNGVESPVGAAEYEPGDGDRIWWDHRDWSTAMRVPAVVGSWPEPFLHGFRATSDWSAGVFCGGAEAACARVEPGPAKRRGSSTGAEPGPEDDGPARTARSASWSAPGRAIADDPVARLLAGGPQRSGVFANFSGVEPSVGLTLLDARGRVAEALTAGAGLVAALRPDEGPPTWVVTGTDDRRRRGRARPARASGACATATRSRSSENEGSVGVPVPMRPALAYAPGRSPLHRAPPWVAVAFLGALALVAFVYSQPARAARRRGRGRGRRARGGRRGGPFGGVAAAGDSADGR